MKIMRNGSIPSLAGPGEWFSGRVRIDGMFQAESPANGTGMAPRRPPR